MFLRSTLAIILGASAVLGLGACRSVYSDAYSYRKNSFKAPVVKESDIKVPKAPQNPLDPGMLPPGAEIPGAPAPGGIPGIPGGGVPAVPAAPAAPAAPPAPAP